MKPVPEILSESDERIMRIAHELHVAYGLKRTLRYATERNFKMHSESVAEHVFGLCFLARYFLPLEDSEGLLDAKKIDDILLFHDFGEIMHGDVPYHLKTAAHEEREREAAKLIFASLPASMQDIASNSWQAYEHQTNQEGRFVYALDKIEPLFELLDPVNELSMKRLKFTYQQHIEKKLKATEHFPVMRKFVEVMSRDMVRREVFWVEE